MTIMYVIVIWNQLLSRFTGKSLSEKEKKESCELSYELLSTRNLGHISSEFFLMSMGFSAILL